MPPVRRTTTCPAPSGTKTDCSELAKAISPASSRTSLETDASEAMGASCPKTARSESPTSSSRAKYSPPTTVMSTAFVSGPSESRPVTFLTRVTVPFVFT